ncbi:MAG: AMP-binding protein [Actinobacteria bacterium]|nr:AMP-binding protein [Actinomycetota bacterium]
MGANLADVLSASAQESPASVALIEGDRRMTYAGLDDAVTALASGLVAKGLQRGDRVAIQQGNTMDFVVTLFGVLRAGGVAVPLNTSLADSEVRQATAAVSPRILIVDPVNEAPDPELSCGVIVTGTPAWRELSDLSGAVDLPESQAEDVAVLLFTSGTEGVQRPAILTHRALLANVEALLALDDPVAISATDRSLAVLPLFHIYSLNAVLALGLAAGATIVLCRRFDPGSTLELIRAHDVTVVAGAPPMYVAWSAEPDLRDRLSHVRLLLSGAAPLAAALFDQFLTVTGHPIWEGYGLTECSPVVATTLVTGRPKAGCVGQALDNVSLKIVPEWAGGPGLTIDGLDDAEEAEPGEIWVRAPSLFSGYWPDGADGPDAEGWFGTGDVGYWDADGDLVLVDRRSDLVIVSGFNVYPREVERAIDAHPAVAECAVLGVPHPYSGEAVKAVVELNPGHSLTTEELVAYCEGRLARFKCPTIVSFVEAMPHDTTGKIAKEELRG